MNAATPTVFACAAIFALPAFAQEVNCFSFAQYLDSSQPLYSTHDDFEMLQGYFKKDLRKDTPSEIQILHDWIDRCESYFRNAEENLQDIAVQHQMSDYALSIEMGIH